MMNFEKTLQAVWDFYPQLEAKIPKAKVTTGPPGKADIPYITIEIDRLAPALMTNKGYLRERIDLHLKLRHSDYVEARWIVDYLHEIFKNRMLFDTETMLRAQTGLTKTTVKKLEDRTWLFTIGIVADADLFSETIPV